MGSLQSAPVLRCCRGGGLWIGFGRLEQSISCQSSQPRHGSVRTVHGRLLHRRCVVRPGPAQCRISVRRSECAWPTLIALVGTVRWAFTVPFESGVLDWQYQFRILRLSKPVKKVQVLALLKGHSGTAYFDDIRLAKLSDGAITHIHREVALIALCSAMQHRQTSAATAYSALSRTA